jgi:hypothetical protein
MGINPVLYETDKKCVYMKRLIIFILMIECFFSCGRTDFCYRTEAKRVLNNFSREYTGIDTLIRIDGYYYHDDGTSLLTPFMLSNNGEFHISHSQYKNHIQIQEEFKNNTPVSRGKGSYTLSGDTITVRWAMPFQYDCYDIFSQQYLILNDTTLKRIWHLCETCNSEKRDPIEDEIYKFCEYSIKMRGVK